MAMNTNMMIKCKTANSSNSQWLESIMQAILMVKETWAWQGGHDSTAKLSMLHRGTHATAKSSACSMLRRQYPA
ncbi:hypothetical protein [Moraxella lacunata]|uniref:hypothetical protein n=1 Tax=Moraxella lacunata TaxID=477 RepID=UPI003EE25E5D